MTGGIATRSAKTRALSADVPTSATCGGSSSGSLRRTAVKAGCDAVTISSRRSWLAAFRVNVPITATAMMRLRDRIDISGVNAGFMPGLAPCGESCQVIESKNVLDEDGYGFRDRCRRFRQVF